MPYFAGILYFLAGLLMASIGADPHDKTLYLGFSVGLALLVTAIQFAGLAVAKWLPNLGTIGSWLIFFMLGTGMIEVGELVKGQLAVALRRTEQILFGPAVGG